MSYTLYHGCIESAIEPIINGEYGVEKSTPIVHLGQTQNIDITSSSTLPKLMFLMKVLRDVLEL